MSQYKYAIKNLEENCAKAAGVSLTMSLKDAVEICSFIRGKKLSWAKAALEEVIALKRAIPYKKHPGSKGHKPGIGPGRYPVNACKEIMTVLNNVETNAQVRQDCRGHGRERRRPFHSGRQGRRKMKRAHFEIVVKEVVDEKKERIGRTTGKTKETAKDGLKDSDSLKNSSKDKTHEVIKENKSEEARKENKKENKKEKNQQNNQEE